ncbi:MAG: mechanosensitive ion channel protein MscS [Pseudomonadales bacterium]|jgi:small-conductance mechanosensitive channel|nr:mechanosensitive ion channel protein MscS [Pseudomonadales bacterium]MCK5792782.1 mechanosensitive ion channel family protein [Ketobacter sp.]TNC85817.1 MAG: mechanosensitive ion channel protein MscS [Alcanivorax sp.]HAG93864.1 mechanosensitive ion channel protein MscS [Gammaproteobacteria bacterium]MAQ27449.1 mechanosensitive ion channel protein MscS [Pseudomonadales bacterium]
MSEWTLSELSGWPMATIISLGSLLAALLIKRLVLKHLQNVTSQSRYYYDSLLISALSFPLSLLIVILHMLLLEYLLLALKVEVFSLQAFSEPAYKILLIIAVVVFADRFLFGLLHRQTTRSEALANSKGILVGITRGIVFGIGALVLLGTLGISVTPIIASLGITSLAVALALQPTLENFFSGVQLVIDKPIRVGDYIELDSGEQGFVEKIGWRSTWIRMLPNNTVIMPNSVLSQSKIINYFYPEKELSVPVEVSVHYNSDLEEVERITVEVAREILKSHKWGVDDYDTFVVFHTFDSSSINFTVMLRAQEYFNRFFIKSEFMKALHRRYREEGIVIPYPIRAINTQQEPNAVSGSALSSEPIGSVANNTNEAHAQTTASAS